MKPTIFLSNKTFLRLSSIFLSFYVRLASVTQLAPRFVLHCGILLCFVDLSVPQATVRTFGYAGNFNLGRILSFLLSFNFGLDLFLFFLSGCRVPISRIFTLTDDCTVLTCIVGLQLLSEVNVSLVEACMDIWNFPILDIAAAIAIVFWAHK